MKKYINDVDGLKCWLWFVSGEELLRRSLRKTLPRGVYYLMGRVTVNNRMFYKITNQVHIYYLEADSFKILETSKCNWLEVIMYKHLRKRKLL